MANGGQKIGGIYVDIGADITTLQQAVSAIVNLAGKINKALETVKMTPDTEGFEELGTETQNIIKMIQDLTKVTENFFDQLQHSGRSLKESLTAVAESTIKSTKTIEDFGSRSSNTLRAVETLINTINQVQADPKFARASAQKQQAIGRIKTEAIDLLQTLKRFDQMIRTAGIAEALKLPEAGVLMPSLEKFAKLLGSSIAPQVGHIKNQLLSWQKIDPGSDKLHDMIIDLQIMNARTRDQEKLFISTKEHLLDMSSVLRVTRTGEWQPLDIKTIKDANNLVDEFVAKAKNVKGGLKDAGEAIDTKFGPPARKIFQALDNQIDQVIARLERLRRTKGITGEQREEVEKQIASLRSLSEQTSKLFTETAKLDQLSVDVDLKRAAVTSDKVRDSVDTIRLSLERSVTKALKLSGAFEAILAVLTSGQPTESILKLLGLDPEGRAELTEGEEQIVQKWRATWDSIDDTAKKGGKEARNSIQQVFRESITGFKGARLDIKDFVPDPKILGQALEIPLRTVEDTLMRLRTRFASMREELRGVIKQEDMKMIDSYIGFLDMLANKMGNTRRTFQAARDTAIDFGTKGLGTAVISQIQLFTDNMGLLAKQTMEMQRLMSLKTMKLDVNFQGSISSLRELLTTFRSASVGIENSWTSMKEVVRAATEKVIEKVDIFRKVTGEISGIGLPGFEEFVKLDNDLNKLSASVETNAQAWHDLNEELIGISQRSPTAWAKQHIKDLIVMRGLAIDNKEKYTALGQEIKRVSTQEGAEKAYYARINELREWMTLLKNTLNEELNMFKEHVQQIEDIYGELAIRAGRQMTKEMKFAPVQTGLEVTEFQADALDKNAMAVGNLKIKLEELNAQETLGIQTKKAYTNQLTVLGEIVERSVPIFGQQVEEIIRLGLAAGKTSVRLDALETIMNKLAEISGKKKVFGEQFSEATARMRLLEEKTKSVAGIIGNLGIGVDATGQKMVDTFSKMDEIVAGIPPDIHRMRAAINSANIVLGQMKSKVGISEDSFKALDKALSALNSNTRDMIKSFTYVEQLREPKVLKALVEELGRLVKEGVDPALEAVHKLFTEMEKEINLDDGIEKAADSIPKLQKELEKLQREMMVTGVTASSLKKEMSLLQQLQVQGVASAAQVKHLKDVQAAMKTLSQQSKNVAELDIAQSAAKLGTVGEKYEIINAKLKVFKQHMDGLIQSLAIMTGATAQQATEEEAKEKIMVENINLRIRRVEQLKFLYESLGSVLHQLRSVQDKKIGLGDKELTQTKAQIEGLAAAIKLFTDIEIDTSKLEGLDLKTVIKILEDALGKVGSRIDIVREKLQQLSAEGQKKLAIGVEVEKTGRDIEVMRERLEILIGAQDRGGASLQNLSAQYKIYQDLMKQGVILEEERARMISLGQTIEVLKQQFIDIVQIQKGITKGQAGLVAIGRGYEAVTNRVSGFKKVISDLGDTVGAVTGRTQNLGNAERQFAQILSTNIDGMNKYITEIQALDKARTMLERVKELKDKKQFVEARDLVRLLRQEMEKLSGVPLELKTKKLEEVEKVIVSLRENAVREVERLMTETGEKFEEFEPKMKIEGLDAKKSQELREAREQLELYGEQEKKGENIAEARQKRIEAVIKAMKLEKAPREEAARFLQDQIVVEGQYIQKLQEELQLRRGHPGLLFKLASETGRNVKLQQLYNTIMDKSKDGTREQAKAYEELAKEAQNLSTQVNKLQGRYKGVTQMVNTLISDIKSLILVQIRWYATQNIIFRFTRGVRDLVKFYAELETQVARVTTAIAAEYNVSAKSVEIMSRLRSEMIRTGSAVEDLATIMWELISAGLSMKEAMAGVSHVTNLALAAELEIGEATRITAGLFRVFGDQVAKAGDASDKFRYINDRLAATLNQSQVDMNGLIAGLGYMINEADAAGLSFEQVLGVLSVLNNRLLLGSKAGRSASRVLTQLTSNAKELAKAFSIDIDFTKPLDLVDVLTKLNAALERGMYQGQLTTIQFDKLQDIFGQVGKRAAVGLITNLDELNKTVAALQTGKFDNLAESMAKLKIETFAQQVKILVARFKLLGKDAIEPVVSLLKGLVWVLNAAGDTLSWLPDTLKRLAVQIAVVYGILRGMGKLLLMKRIATSSKALEALSKPVTALILYFRSLTGQMDLTEKAVQGVAFDFKQTFTILVPAAMAKTTKSIWATVTSLTALKAALTGFWMGLNKIGLAIAAVVFAGYLLYKAYKKQEEALRTANTELEKAREAYLETLDAIEAEQQALRELAEEYRTTIPYTEKWLRVRERLKLQYPGILAYLDAELATTGEIEKSIAKWTELTQKRIELLERLEKLEEKEAKQLRELEIRLSSVTRKMYGLYDGANALGRELESTTGLEKFRKNVVDLAKGFTELIIQGKELPKDVNLIWLQFKRLEEPVFTLQRLKELLLGVGDAGQVANSELLRVIRDLPPEIQDIFKDYNIKIGVEIGREDVRKMVKDIEKEIEKETAFADIETEYAALRTRLQRPLLSPFAALAPDATKKALTDAIAEASTFVDKFEKETPATLKATLVEMDADLREIQQRNLVARKKLLSEGASDIDKLRAELSSYTAAFDEHQKKFSDVSAAYYYNTLQRMIELMRSLQGASEQEQRSIEARLRIYYGRMGSLSREHLKRAGINIEKFEQLLRGGMDVSSKEAKNLIKDFEKIGEKQKKVLGDAGLAMAKQIVDMVDNVNDLEAAYERMFGTISRISAHGTNVVREHLERNQNVIRQVMAALPAHARKMMAQATVVERLEMVREAKNTVNEINLAIAELGIIATPGVREQIRAQKFQEYYNKIKLISKDFYETEKKLMDESRKYLSKTISEMGSERSIHIQRNLDLLTKQRDIELKYAEQLITAETKIKAARELSVQEESQQEFDKLTKRIEFFNEKVDEANQVIEEMGRKLEVLQEVREDFSTLLIGKQPETLEAIFKQNIGDIQEFLAEDERLLVEAFKKLIKNIDSDQAKFLNEIIEELRRHYGWTHEVALLWFQTLFKDYEKLGFNFDKTIATIEQKTFTTMKSTQDKLYDLQLNRYHDNQQLGIIMDKIRGEDLDSNVQYQTAKLQEDQILFQKETENNHARLEASEQFYNDMAALRKRELEELDKFVATFDSVMSPQQYLNLMQERLKIQEKFNVDQRNRIQETIENYKRLKSGLVKQITETNEAIKRIESYEPPYTKAEEEAIANMKARQTQILAEKENYANKMKEIDEKIAGAKGVPWAQKYFEKRYELQKAAIQGNVDVLKEEETELQQALAEIDKGAKLRNTASLRQFQNYTEQLKVQYEATIRDLAGKHAELLLIEPRELADFAIKSIQRVQQIAQEQLERAKVKVEAQFLVGDVDLGSIKEWESDILESINEFSYNVKEEFVEKLDKALREGTGDVRAKYATYRIIFEDLMRKSYLETIERTKTQARDAIREMLETSLQEIEATAPVLRMDIDIPALKAAGVEVSNIFQWQDQLVGKAEDQKERLKDMIELQRQVRLEAEAEMVPLREKVEKTKKAVEDGKKGIIDRIKEKDKYDELVAAAREYELLVERKAKLEDKSVTYKEGEAEALDEQLIKQDKIINQIIGEGKARKDVLNALKDQGILIQAADEAALNQRINYQNWAQAIDMALRSGQSLAELAKYTGSAWDRALLGMVDALWDFQRQATDFFEVWKGLANTVLEGLNTAIVDTWNAIFRPPKQEIENMSGELRELEEEAARIKREMDLIEVGLVLPEEAAEHLELTQQWKEVQKEIAKARGELDKLESTSRRVGEAFKKFAQTLLDALADIIARLIIVNILSSLGGLFGKQPAKGGPIGTRWLQLEPVRVAKGGIIEGGIRPFTKEQTTLLQTLKATFFQSGGIAGGPTLGVIGEGGQSEAVVPLPDNRSIPVTFTGEGGRTQDIKVINLMDPKMIPSIMLQHPEAIINVINEDIASRGPIYQIIRSIKR